MRVDITPRELAASWFVIEYKEDSEARVPKNAVSNATQFLACLPELETSLRGLESPDEGTLQTEFYNIGKSYFGEENLRDFFKCFYLTVLGSTNGSRIGVFVAILGVEDFFRRLENRLQYLKI